MRIRIEDIRKAKSISQAELAKRAGISRPYLSQLETGQRSLTVTRQHQIAAALGVPASELVDFDAPDGDDEEIILQAYREASPEQRQVLLALARALIPSEE